VAGRAYLAWLGFKMLTAKPGAAPVLNIQPRHYFKQALVITLLNPKAIVFYMAFFPLFVDPAATRACSPSASWRHHRRSPFAYGLYGC
jgi:threonine/homoserine/homoserine lactone efflux protein